MTKKTTKKNAQTTYDRFVQKMTPAHKKQFEKEYQELVLSELQSFKAYDLEKKKT